MKVNSVKLIDSFFSEAFSLMGDQFLQSCERANVNPKALSFSRLPISKIHRLCMELNVSLDAIVSQQVDFQALEAQQKGQGFLPSLYSGASSYSSRFTSIYMLNFLRDEFGELAVNSLYQRFQLRRDFFQDISDSNTILLPSDICQYVAKWYGEEVVERMGESSFELFLKTPILEELSFLNPRQFFEKLIFDVLPVKIERNFLWSIESLSPESVTLVGRPREDVADLLNKHSRASSSSLEILRSGFIRSLPKIFGSKEATIRQVQSCSAGDEQDTYILDFSSPRVIRPAFH
jgi:hypothetical protein